MKASFSTLLALSLLSLAGSARAEQAATPEACSVSVGVTTMFGTFRTWTNVLETRILEEKGLSICQDDAILALTPDQFDDLTEEAYEKLLHCKTEFKLELLFRPDEITRNVTIYKNGQELFDRDYPLTSKSKTMGSLKILRTIPTCAELQALSAQKSKSASK